MMRVRAALSPQRSQKVPLLTSTLPMAGIPSRSILTCHLPKAITAKIKPMLTICIKHPRATSLEKSLTSTWAGSRDRRGSMAASHMARANSSQLRVSRVSSTPSTREATPLLD
jgi:hypothetical protein